MLLALSNLIPRFGYQTDLGGGSLVRKVEAIFLQYFKTEKVLIVCAKADRGQQKLQRAQNLIKTWLSSAAIMRTFKINGQQFPTLKHIVCSTYFNLVYSLHLLCSLKPQSQCLILQFKVTHREMLYKIGYCSSMKNITVEVPDDSVQVIYLEKTELLWNASCKTQSCCQQSIQVCNLPRDM